tara:strand:- start:172 stop:699 length:528 start_codon:yes stop_codon:yes gene_type:complete
MKIINSKSIAKILLIVCSIFIILNENTVLSLKFNVQGILDDPISSIPDLDDVQLGFLQKGTAKKIEEEDSNNNSNNDLPSRYSGAGFVNPTHQNVSVRSQGQYTRFKQAKEYDDAQNQFDNLHYQKNERNNPAQSRELIRQKDLSNGVILVDKKRTANFETGQYLDFFYAMQRTT